MTQGFDGPTWPTSSNATVIVTRRPVGVTSSHYRNPLVICDDGSVWVLMPENKWEEQPAIPGTQRAAARAL